MDRWIIELHDCDGNDLEDTAESPEEALEVIRRFLTPASHKSDDEPSPFEEIFRGAAPEDLLRHVRHAVEHRNGYGRLVIRRVRHTR